MACHGLTTVSKHVVLMFLQLCMTLPALLDSLQTAAFPQQTGFSNSTRLSPSKATPTGCAHRCWRDYHTLTSISWQKASIATTITIETLLFVVNNRTNSTRTSTIFNTEVDLSQYAPPNTTNSAATVTTSVILDLGSTKSTKYVAFPTTAYEDYDSTYSLCGTVATSVGGMKTCMTYQNGCDISNGVTRINSFAPTFTYPSHPPMQEGIQSNIDLAKDPRGWTYAAVIEDSCDEVEPLFPDLGLWSCNFERSCVAPAVFLQTALFLTANSTSTEANPPSTSTKPMGPGAPATHTPAGPSVPPVPLPPSRTTPKSSTEIAGQTEDDPAFRAQSSAKGTSSALAITSSSTSTVNPQDVSGSSAAATSQQSGVLPIVVVQSPDLNPSASAQLDPVVLSSTDVRGSVIISTSTAVAIPVFISETNAQGQVTASTSISTAPTSVSIPTVISSTNAQGVFTSSIYYIPANVESTTNAEGIQVADTSPVPPAIALSSANTQDSQVLTTSPILPLATSPPVLTIGTQGITANAQNQYVIGSQTLTSGGAITVSGTPVSLAPGGKEAFVGTTIEYLSPQTFPAITSPPALTLGSQTTTPDAQGQYLIGSQTFTQGDVVTISGVPISLAVGGAYVVVGTGTASLAPTAQSVLTIGTQIITPNAQSKYIIGSQTLDPGSIVTVSGTPVSLARNEAYAVIGTSTELFAITSPPLLTVGTQTITADAQGEYIIDGQTLTPGGVVTVSGARISLAPDETNVVIGTSTEGLGGYIIGGLGGSGLGGSGGANGSGVLGFTGGAARERGTVWLEGILIGGGIVAVICL